MTRRIGSLQAAWLAEIGVDPHWLGLLAAGGAAETAARSAGARHASAGPARTTTPPAAPAPPDADIRPAGRSEAGSRAAAPVPISRIEAPPVDPASPLAAVDRDILACQACGLHADRARAVPGAGQDRNPLYLIIGEMPGVADDATGRPFEGQAGRLLRAMLVGARLPDPDAVYLTNVLKCRPPGGRAAHADEVAACMPHLQRQIDILRPRFILVLGRLAAQALLGTRESLDALRGREHRHVLADGSVIPVWVTHHPASLLVRPAHKAQAWGDLVALARAARDGAPAA